MIKFVLLPYTHVMYNYIAVPLSNYYINRIFCTLYKYLPLLNSLECKTNKEPYLPILKSNLLS